MKYKLCVIPVIMLVAACSSNQVKYANDTISNAPVYKLKNYDGPEAMDSNEVLNMSKQCILNKMRPNVSYLSVRSDQGKVQVPVSVICEGF